MSFFLSQNTPKSMSDGSPQTPLRELTALPQTSLLVSLGPLRGWRGIEGRIRGGGGRGKGEWGREGKRKRWERNSALVLGDRRPWVERGLMTK